MDDINTLRAQFRAIVEPLYNSSPAFTWEASHFLGCNIPVKGLSLREIRQWKQALDHYVPVPEKEENDGPE